MTVVKQLKLLIVFGWEYDDKYAKNKPDFLFLKNFSYF